MKTINKKKPLKPVKMQCDKCGHIDIFLKCPKCQNGTYKFKNKL